MPFPQMLGCAGDFCPTVFVRSTFSSILCFSYLAKSMSSETEYVSINPSVCIAITSCLQVLFDTHLYDPRQSERTVPSVCLGVGSICSLSDSMGFGQSVVAGIQDSGVFLVWRVTI